MSASKINKVLLVDHDDSFTHNLLRYFQCLGKEALLCSFRDLNQIDSAFKQADTLLVFSPGPKSPSAYPQSQAYFLEQHRKQPVLGICLGHQLIAEAFGATVGPAKQPLHGESSELIIAAHALFLGCQQPLTVGRYHSLIVNDLPASCQALAWTAMGELMAFSHKTLPIFGFQFHPESILSPDGLCILSNVFLAAEVMLPQRETSFS